MAYVDSGASFSIFSARLVEKLDFLYKKGQLDKIIVGNGNMIPIYLHRLKIKIGEYQFFTPIGFSENLGVGFNLLGRAGIFNRFDITFSDSKRKITFTEV